jgi:hypothetical protein
MLLRGVATADGEVPKGVTRRGTIGPVAMEPAEAGRKMERLEEGVAGVMGVFPRR